jgi:hypothetical protein
MAQSRRGVIPALEAQVRLLVIDIPRFIQLTMSSLWGRQLYCILQQKLPIYGAFVVVKAGPSITAWGNSTFGGVIPTSINAKVVSYTMNGDISVDIEPIHRFPPPVNESPHTVIDPSALRAAKEYAVE